MKKVKAYLLGILIMGGFILLAWFLYKDVASTTALIINITLLMIGLLISITVVNRTLNKKNKIQVDKSHYPRIEKDLLPITPEAFCEKLHKYKGSLYLIDPEVTEKDIYLLGGEYNKLTDQILLHFTGGLNTIITGAKTVEVGYFQFLIRKFETIQHAKGKKSIFLRWERSHLYQVRGKDEEVPIATQINMPILVFDWSEYPEQNNKNND